MTDDRAVRLALAAGANSVALTRLRDAVQTIADNSQTPQNVREALLRALTRSE